MLVFEGVAPKRVVVKFKNFTMNELYIGPLQNTSNDFFRRAPDAGSTGTHVPSLPHNMPEKDALLNFILKYVSMNRKHDLCEITSF